MRRAATLTLSLAIVALAAGPASASLFLADWGVSYDSWNPTGFTGSHVNYYTEDWTPETNENGWLDPGYGGDLFDVEAMYFGIDDENYYFAVVTGFGPEGRDWYRPGDLFVDFGQDGYDYAFITHMGGALVTDITHYENAALDWGGVSDPFRVQGFEGSPMPVGDWSYGEFDGRYALEVKIDKNFLGPVSDYHIHWTMQCGNDAGDLVDSVPEPATLLLVGGGLLGIGARRFRRKR